MTAHLLEVVPRDVAAEELGLVLDAPAPPALAELVLRDGADRLVLGVLGSSHVVTAGRGAHRLVEQVSCDALAAGGVPLPRARETATYALRSRTRVLPAAEVAALAAELRDTADRDDAWLCATFPTSSAAVTALTGAPVAGGWSWRTWHLYPGPREGVVVSTTSRWTP